MSARIYNQRNNNILYFLIPIIMFFANSSWGSDRIANMFRDALRDPTMQYLSRENFHDIRITAGCAALALQWRSGRIANSTPDQPGDQSVSLTMHGMAEVTLFLLAEQPRHDVDLYLQRALRQFENSSDFRERASSVCTALMIPMIRFVMQRNDIIK